MGCYDTVLMPVKCPRCGEEHEMHCQTKEIGRNLLFFHLGESVTNDFDQLFCYASCKNHHIFTLNVFLKYGIVTGEYEIVESEPKI